MRRKTGFTLIEVMVAVVIVAVGFAAVWRAAGLAVDALELSRAKISAMWAARNSMAEIKIGGAWPEVGETKETVTEGNRSFFMLKTVSQTRNVHFRKVVIEIRRSENDGYILAKLNGFALNENALQENNGG